MNLAFNRGKGGLTLNGEFRKTLNCSFDIGKAKAPSFFDTKKRIGSIGWGVQSTLFENHGRSVNFTDPPEKIHLSSQIMNNLTKRGSNKIICKDRFHIRKIDNDHSITGNSGFLKLPGRFSANIDKKMQMQYKPFYSMNMSYQKKCIKDITTSQALAKYQLSNMKNQNKITRFSPQRISSTMGKFPDMKELIKQPGTYKANLFLGNKTLIGFGKCNKFEKYQQKHTPHRVKLMSNNSPVSTKRSTA